MSDVLCAIATYGLVDVLGTLLDQLHVQTVRPDVFLVDYSPPRERQAVEYEVQQYGGHFMHLPFDTWWHRACPHGSALELAWQWAMSLAERPEFFWIMHSDCLLRSRETCEKLCSLAKEHGAAGWRAQRYDDNPYHQGWLTTVGGMLHVPVWSKLPLHFAGHPTAMICETPNLDEFSVSDRYDPEVCLNILATRNGITPFTFSDPSKREPPDELLDHLGSSTLHLIYGRENEECEKHKLAKIRETRGLVLGEKL